MMTCCRRVREDVFECILEYCWRWIGELSAEERESPPIRVGRFDGVGGGWMVGPLGGLELWLLSCCGVGHWPSPGGSLVAWQFYKF
jgi:hypothetical protein